MPFGTTRHDALIAYKRKKRRQKRLPTSSNFNCRRTRSYFYCVSSAIVISCQFLKLCIGAGMRPMRFTKSAQLKVFTGMTGA